MRGEDIQILCVRHRPLWCGEDVNLIDSASESFPASLCLRLGERVGIVGFLQ